MLQRYLGAGPPKKGETASVAYRIRLLLLDRWNLWPRLTRYRTMRGYKREESAAGVSRLLAWAGNHTGRGGAPLVQLLG